MNSVIKLASDEADILKCWTVLYELRPHLVKSSFTETVRQMIAQGYLLAFIEQDDIAVAAIGFRRLQFLFNGDHIYIDDLSTLPGFRGRGLATSLLDFVCQYAMKNGLKTVTLDSGFQRHDAHKLYLAQGLKISSLHFSKQLE